MRLMIGIDFERYRIAVAIVSGRVPPEDEDLLQFLWGLEKEFAGMENASFAWKDKEWELSA